MVHQQETTESEFYLVISKNIRNHPDNPARLVGDGEFFYCTFVVYLVEQMFFFKKKEKIFGKVSIVVSEKDG